MQVSKAAASLQGCNSSTKELSRLGLQGDEVVRRQLGEDSLKRRAIGLEQEEFTPESFTVLKIDIIFVLEGSAGVNMLAGLAGCSA